MVKDQLHSTISYAIRQNLQVLYLKLMTIIHQCWKLSFCVKKKEEIGHLPMEVWSYHE